MANGNESQPAFFISRAGADKEIAVIVAKILEDAGFRTYLQDNDFGHASFMARMAEGWSSGARVICLLSKSYQKSEHCKKEYEVALKEDPRNLKEKVIVLRIEDCWPIEHLADLAFTDLVPVLHDADSFARVVRTAVGPRERGRIDVSALHRRTAKQVLHNDVRPVPGFAGRDAELQALHAALWGKVAEVEASTFTASVALTGLGGVGKSVLAQQYAWQYRGRYHGVWWIRAERSETLLDDLIELGSRFIPGLKEVAERAQAAHSVLDHIAQFRTEAPWLLVYDNVEQPDQIAKLTPISGAHVLITTRWPDWYGFAEELSVEVFSERLALDFLLARARDSAPEAAARLAADVGYLPLALAHARALCWSEGSAFERYRSRLSELIRKAPRGTAYPTPVFATFELAIAKAVTKSALAERLMSICVCLAPDHIPLGLITDIAMSEGERGEAIAALQEMSLVSLQLLEDGSPGLSIHRLVQEVARARLGSAAPEATALAVQLVSDAYPSDAFDVGSWVACARLDSHVLAVLPAAPTEGDAARLTASLLGRHALYLHARGEFADAEAELRRALAIEEANFGLDDLYAATTLNSLGMVLLATSRVAEATVLFRRSLDITEKVGGPDHPNIGTLLNNLAEALRVHASGLPEAETLMRRALAAEEAALGGEHPRVGSSLVNLGDLLRVMGRFPEAKALFDRGIRVLEGRLGQHHPEVARAANNFAVLLMADHKWIEAETLMHRALAIDETCAGSDHHAVARDLVNLGEISRQTGRYADAEPLLARAARIFEKSIGTNSREMTGLLNNQALLFQATDRLADAEAALLRALRIDEECFGHDSLFVARDIAHLADVLRQAGRYAEAEQLFTRAIRIFGSSLGAEHPEMISSLAAYAVLLELTGRSADAKTNIERALAIAETKLGPDHQITLRMRSLRTELQAH